MKVNSKKGFGYIEDPSNLGTIGEDVISQFAQKMNKSGKYASEQDWINANPEIIYYARQLKAQHDGKHVRKYKIDDDGKKVPEAYQEYSDMYYLEYALHHVQGNHLRDLNILSSPTLGINALDDPEWSQYSPEEIVQMADNGYVVPDKVLVWAHSMRESDITAYVILSDESGVDGEAESGVDTDVNSLRKQATDYILKVNKEQENIDENSKKIEQKQKEVKNIEKQNKLFRKYSIEKIKSDADELKELEEKAKNGKLDVFEKAKLKKLQRQLNEESTRIKNLQDTEDKMNDFLSSIDALQKEANEDIQLADETVAAAEELAKLKNEFDENKLTSAASEALTSQNRGMSDILAGTLTPEIPDIADKVATQLRDTSQEVIVSLDSEKAEGYVDFAKNYVQGAEKVQETLGISEENKVPEEGNKDNGLEENSENVKDGNNGLAEFMSKAFWFVLPFSANPAVAYMMAVATLASTDTTKDIRRTVAEENKELQKGLKEYNKASKKQEEETNKAEAQKVANDDKLEELNTKALELDEKSSVLAAEVENSVQAAQSPVISEENNNQENIDDIDGKISENDAISSEKDLISAEIGNITTSGQEVMNKLSATVNNTNKILRQNMETSKSINANSAELQKSNETTKSLSAKSTLGGAFTTTVGIYNLSVAVPLLVQATAMMASLNPITVSMGMTLAAIAKSWIGVGTAQTITGAGEVASGVLGSEEAGLANIQLAANKEPQSTHSQNVKMSREQVKHSNETLTAFAASLGVDINTENSPAVLADRAKDNQEKPQDANKQTQNNLPQTEMKNNNNDVNNFDTDNAGERFEQAQNIVKTMPSMDNLNNELQNPKNGIKANNSKSNIEEKIIINKKDSPNSESGQNEISETDINLKIEREKNLKYREEQEQKDKTDKEIEEEVTKAVEQEEQQAKIDLEKEKQVEEQKIQENLQTLQAAASTGVNIVSALDANDKSEKKLTRFNNDSIIESRKKARRVTAISEAQKKRA